MADGSRQTEFHLPRKVIASALQPGEIVIDMFAGGGGASEALEQALGRPVDLAINHDEWAIGMHAANHPFTIHKREDVWTACPRAEAAGRPVGWFHASPDCTHFSQARGGQPRSRRTRALSWVVVKWVGALKRSGNAPRLLSLENVEQILKWGPLVAKRCKATGRVQKLDGSVAARGERVPLELQQLIPDKAREGQTWQQFVAILRSHGYAVEWKKLIASDFGAGTSRKRLFLIARRDGAPIVWPEPTHGPGRLPVVTAAQCIDWSIACPSIFTRKKPLADATLRRIARGIRRYVLEASEPFIVPAPQQMESDHDRDVRRRSLARKARAGRGSEKPNLGGGSGGGSAVSVRNASALRDGGGRTTDRLDPWDLWTGGNFDGSVLGPSGGCAAASRTRLAPVLTEHANSSGARSWSSNEPLRTQCANVKGGHFALAAATLVHTGYGERAGQAPRVPGLEKPLGTLVDGVKHAAVTATLAGVSGRAGNSEPRGVDRPCYTTTGKADCAVVTAFLEQANTGMVGHAATEPVSTIIGKGSTQRLVTAHMATIRGDNTGAAVDEPVRTMSAGGEHHAVVECTLSPEHEAGALKVAAFLVKYYGTALGVDIAEPLDTVTTRDRLALVTVEIRGTPYVIVDIGLRMLQRHELFKAQGFPDSYIIDRTADGRRLNVSQSVRMVGNSVSPPPLRAAVAANLPMAGEFAEAA